MVETEPVEGMSNPLFYREYGKGFPLLFLHGGWGYGLYPFDVQIRLLKDQYRILIPDRTGYGKSPHSNRFPRGFHEIAAEEMRQFLATLTVDKCMLWGHSDGAVTAVRMALKEPDRFPAVIVEAIHYDRCKPSSRNFFETAAMSPRNFGSTLSGAMAREHGENYWEELMSVHGRAWLDILDNCQDAAHDLYSGGIAELRSAALAIHGSNDPRTEPDELSRLQAAVPRLEMRIFDGATHSPHSEALFAEDVTSAAAMFLDRHRLAREVGGM